MGLALGRFPGFRRNWPRLRIGPGPFCPVMRRGGLLPAGLLVFRVVLLLSPLVLVLGLWFAVVFV